MCPAADRSKARGASYRDPSPLASLMLRNPFTPPCGFDISTTSVEGDLSAITLWGYRLVTHPDGACFIHETYYDEREGLLGIAREPARPCGDTAEDVRDELRRMEEGLAERPRPVQAW